MAISYWVGAVVALVMVSRRLHGTDGPRVMRLHVRAVVAGLVAGAAGIGVRVLMGTPEGFTSALALCVVATVVMCLVYVGGLALLRVRELDAMVKPVLRRLRRR
jgi:putative peptidoglycan lipid II flippase